MVAFGTLSASILRLGVGWSWEVGVTEGGGTGGSEKRADDSARRRGAAPTGGDDHHGGKESRSDGTPSSKKEPTGNDRPGEEKCEDRGGGLRADAKWVVLLGVLSAAVTVLTYVGIQWPTFTHFIARAAASSPSPSVSDTLPTTPVPTSSASSSLTPTSSPSPSPTQDLGSPAVVPSNPVIVPYGPVIVPSDYNNVGTDPTDVGVNTMLPLQYNDSGIVFSRTSGWAVACGTYASAGVSQTLNDYGCTSEVVGTYLNSFLQIQVAVWVVPLPSSTDSEGLYNTLAQGGTPGSWGILCPEAGVTGSWVCQHSWLDATRGGRIGYCHRYLVRAVALYVDLQSDSALESVLTAAAEAADGAIGPQNIPIARCWPSTAG
jgi:hypothetical protein